MDPQPIFEFDDVEEHNRATTFFRLILAIPHLVVMTVWTFLAAVAALIAWFAILFTTRYPPGLYKFVGDAQRYSTAVYGYMGLLTDVYPKFGAPAEDTPVRLLIPEPKASYSRSLAFFRIILAIPVLLISYAMGIIEEIGALLNWFAIVFTGRRQKDFQSMVVLGRSYQARASIYTSLMTERWPPLRSPLRGALTGDFSQEPAPLA